jgi:hydroxymethylglutaryl-CoA reductase (NADPH)
VTVHCGDAVNGAGILSDLAARGERRKLLGLFPLQVDYTGSDGAPRRLDLVAKVKPLDAEVLIEMGKLASLGGRRIADAWERHARATAFAGSHRRETAIYRSEDPALVRVLPRCYGVHEEPAREAFVVLMEDLRTSAVLFDQASMRPAHIDAALDGIAAVHAAWLGRDGDAAALGAVDGIVPVDSMELWRALAEHNAAEHPTLVDDEFRSVLGGFAASAEQWSAELAAMPRTLVHHDFNPRNIALRRDSLVLVAYDWELAAWHVPQRDLAELLAFVLTPATTPAEVAHYVDRHRASIAARGGAVLDAALWRQGYRLALRDFALTRLQLYLMGHTHREYPFLDQVVRTVRRLCEIEANLATARAVV